MKLLSILIIREKLFPIQVIRELNNAGGSFRVLGLSATPGNDLKVN